MRNLSPCWALVPLCLVPATAGAGVIRGTLYVPAAQAVAAKPNPYPGRASSLPGSHSGLRGAVTDAVLYVEAVPAEAESALVHDAQPVRLAQKNQAFVPRVLAVAVGTTVDFPNLDPIYHNVFSVSPVKRFDLGKYPKGQSKRVTFGKPGLVNVFCDIHSNMEAFVMVLPHHAFAQPAESGSFALPELSGGRYTLKVWHPDRGELHREVEVPESGDVTLELRY
jgi:plastocyanin